MEKCKGESNFKYHDKQTPKDKTDDGFKYNFHESKTYPVNKVLDVLSLNFGSNDLESEVAGDYCAADGSHQGSDVDEEWDENHEGRENDGEEWGFEFGFLL